MSYVAARIGFKGEPAETLNLEASHRQRLEVKAYMNA